MRGLLAAACAALAAASYDPTKALSMAWLSSVAYCDAAQVTTWNCQACANSGVTLNGTTFMSNANTTAFGYTGYDAASGSVYVSYRGSQTLQNWILNIDAVLIPYAPCAGCNVHQGFYDSYLSLAGELDAALSKMNGKSSNGVYFTGHSLGAAMTMLTAFDLAVAGYPVAEMLNFGQPRVGDQAYANGFESLVIGGADGLKKASSDAAGAPRFNIGPLVAEMKARTGKAAALASMNEASTEAVLAAPAHLLVSPLQVRAVERALAHPLNAHLAVSEADAAALVALLHEHAALAVASARGEAALSALLRSKSYVGVDALALTDAQVNILSGLTMIGAAPSAARKAPLATQTLRKAPKATVTSGGGGMQAYRVTHNADIVPHLPPEVLGYKHSFVEVWYNEPSTSYTVCSNTNGEDPTCSDSIALPVSVSDHLDYMNIKIDGDC